MSRRRSAFSGPTPREVLRAIQTVKWFVDVLNEPGPKPHELRRRLDDLRRELSWLLGEAGRSPLFRGRE